MAEAQICLLTDDGTPTTLKLAQSLVKQGWKVVILSFPQSIVAQQSFPEGIDRIVMELNEDLNNYLAAIAATYGSIGAFIHLHPCFENNKLSFLEADKAILKQVFLIAKHLKKSLNRAAEQGFSCFVTAARLDGAFGLGEHAFSAIGAGLFGLTKSLNLEWKSVFCRAIDLSPKLSAQSSAQYILAEIHDPNRCLTEVGYSSQGRTTLTIEPFT